MKRIDRVTGAAPAVPAKKGRESAHSAGQASHDSVNPPALVEFMLSGWRPRPSRAARPIAAARTFAQRRARLAALFPGEILIIPTGHEKIRNNDNTYRFRPGSDFYWLTGDQEPDCVLALVPDPKGHASWLFVEENPGRSSPAFFTDRSKGELWVGPRLGVAESGARYGADRALGLSELPARFHELFAAGRPTRVVRGLDPAVDALAPAPREADRALAAALSELRLYKDAIEIRALARAVAATRRAYDDVLRELPRLATEREVEATFDRRARIEGNGVGYGTIAASGAHATILHWTRNDGPVAKGDLLLIDAGVEGEELYTADLTRTFPVSGRFTAPQRDVYGLVLAAQRAAFAQVVPGADFLAPHRAAMAVFAGGLHRMGILKEPPEVALAEDKQFHKRWTLHNVSHMLGLDVHDCAHARAESYRQGKLAPGMVLTVEPGLYFQVDDLRVPPKYRGIGVRIEDDVLVTARGHEILTADFPREIEDVERWVREKAGRR